MEKEDMDTISQIDADILGIVRKDYYKEKVEKITSKKDEIISFVALDGNKVIGFIIGDIYIGEYGLKERAAVIDTIGISPNYQGFGIAKKLFKEFLNSIKKLGIRNIYTIVDWEDYDLLKFFHEEGFTPSNKITLELKY
jgi:N-acetylglutamate synthase-like GNAT family acetyltransferase